MASKVKQSTISKEEAIRIEATIDACLDRIKGRAELYDSSIEQSDIEEVEHEACDGFSPFSDNHGGGRITGFYFDLYSAMQFARNKFAAATLDQFEVDAIADAKKELIEKHPELEGNEFDYQSLWDEGRDDLAEELSELERDDNESYMVMFEVRFQGKESGVYSFLVQSVFNWEYPYHRSGISWLPNFKTEVYKQIELELVDLNGLESVLNEALNSGLNFLTAA